MKKPLVIGLLLTLLFTNSSFAENPLPEEDFYISGAVKAAYINRGKEFSVASIGWWNPSTTPTPTTTEIVQYDLDRWTGGYEVEVGTAKLYPFGFSASFEQQLTSFKDIKHNLPGQFNAGTSDIYFTAMGFIDQGYSKCAEEGFVINLAMSGDSREGMCTLQYDFSYMAGRMHASYEFLNEDRFKVNAFIGPAYARFYQKYKISTFGYNSNDNSEASSYTDEKLTDNLFGASVGLAGNIKLYKNLSLNFKEMFEIFCRTSELHATQDLINVTTLSVDYLYDTLGENDSSVGITPHFLSRTELAYDITKDISISCYYDFDLWTGLSRVVNPIIQMNTTGHSNSVHISDEEQIVSHAIGAKVAYRF